MEMIDDFGLEANSIPNSREHRTQPESRSKNVILGHSSLCAVLIRTSASDDVAAELGQLRLLSAVGDSGF